MAFIPAAARPQDTRTTRELILDAAERRFAERGFTGVSMRELAADAGLRNQASLYNHFRNKRALYEEVLAAGLAPIVEVIAASGKGRGAAEGAEHTGTFLDLLLDYLIAHPHLPRLIQRAVLEDSRYLRKALTRMLRPLYAEGIEVLAGAGALWQPADLPHLGAGIYQLIFGYFANAKLLQMVIDGDPLSPSALERQRRFIKDAVARLLTPPARGPAAPAATARKKLQRGATASPPGAKAKTDGPHRGP